MKVEEQRVALAIVCGGQGRGLPSQQQERIQSSHKCVDLVYRLIVNFSERWGRDMRPHI